MKHVFTAVILTLCTISTPLFAPLTLFMGEVIDGEASPEDTWGVFRIDPNIYTELPSLAGLARIVAIPISKNLPGEPNAPHLRLIFSRTQGDPEPITKEVRANYVKRTFWNDKKAVGLRCTPSEDLNAPQQRPQPQSVQRPK